MTVCDNFPRNIFSCYPERFFFFTLNLQRKLFLSHSIKAGGNFYSFIFSENFTKTFKKSVKKTVINRANISANRINSIIGIIWLKMAEKHLNEMEEWRKRFFCRFKKILSALQNNTTFRFFSLVYCLCANHCFLIHILNCACI